MSLTIIILGKGSVPRHTVMIMRKIVAAIFTVFVLSALCACGAARLKPADFTLSEYSDAVVNDKVQLYIKQRTVTDETESVTVALENLTDKDYTYDAAQRLEYQKEDGQWYVVPSLTDAVPLIIYNLPADGQDETTFYFEAHYDKLVEGTYRIVIPLVDSDGTSTIATAEFDIGR